VLLQKVLPKLRSQTYQIQIETIRQAKLQNLRVGETPITFENRKKRKSKLTLTEIVAFSKHIIKVMLEQDKTRVISTETCTSVALDKLTEPRKKA
jgi:hypothetical protein